MALFFSSILALPFIYIFLIISITAYFFSPNGRDYQNKIHEIIINSVKRQNGVLDVGCGNGNLIIKIAKLNHSQNYAIDYWGEDWEYSKKQCEINSLYENVHNVIFKKASASNLPFKSSTIENIISCLTFHEVKDEPNKCYCIQEALRVLQPGGTFTILDLFDDKKYFPDKNQIRQTIIDSGCTIELDKKLSELITLPFPLNKKQVLKYAVLISGRKSSILT